ncbi:response regulator [Paenibacillus endoradicis]|uniref:response regulator n=1 Tax=Paenibacillus endoradicis TaxID=2972487 RepID=UPI00215920E6|nr:response regulator [Paenibacillus endoradicis]MCR8658646.1 response regulator [Paenibacillus endoradicis]
MKVVIVDDEPIMLLTMKRMLSSVEGIELVGSFQNAAEVHAFIAKHDVDLVFLDIQIANDDGIELARHLRLTLTDIDIVFTTSHSDYAIEAYDVYPLDYMVKPISRQRLLQTINRAVDRHSHSSDKSNQLAEAGEPKLKVRTFGCFEANSENQGAVKWISKKSEEIFAYLIVHRGQSIAKMRIIEDVFSDMPYKNAEIYLNTAIYQLRKALLPHGFKEIIITGQEKYRVEISQLDVDFIAFDYGVAQLTEVNDENVDVAIELEKRVSGELFEEQSFVWAAMERESMNVLYQNFANQLANWLFIYKRYREAIQIVRKLISRNEFDEKSNQLLLKIVGAMGDKQSLHNYYNDYVQLLQRELNLKPSATMQQIYYQYQL